jgi:SRSO17 transposase
MKNNNKNKLYNPNYWGISNEAIEKVKKIFNNLKRRFKECFRTKKKNMFKYAYMYMIGLINIEKSKTMLNISRLVMNANYEYENIQYFISESPWESDKIFDKITKEVSNNSKNSKRVLTLDDTGIKKYGNHSIGVGRQYIGREGKVDNGQVTVCLGFYSNNSWKMIDGELYIPENWFNTKSRKELTEKWLLPNNRTFLTKYEIAYELINKALKRELEFDMLVCDSWYGRSSDFRYILNDKKIKYVADIPINTKILSELSPDINTIEYDSYEHKLEGEQYLLFEDNLNARMIRDFIKMNDFESDKFSIRPTERGELICKCYRKRVKTVAASNGKLMSEWFFIIELPDGTYRFSLSNCDDKLSLKELAEYHCYRYFIERVFQDSKSNLGLVDLEARKYRSFMHHLSLVALCLYLMSLIKELFYKEHHPDDSLKELFEVNSLPIISISCICDLFRILYPLKILTLEGVIKITVDKLVRRVKAMASKHRKKIRLSQYSEI